MAELLPVSDARARILAAVKTLELEYVALDQSLGRVLGADTNALRRQPPGDVSAMDGYAANSRDLASLPVTLEIVETIAAGHIGKHALVSGQAARIFTGALVPDGADIIVLQENTKATDGHATITEGSTASGKNIRRAGSDFDVGQTLLRRGLTISARHIALLAAMDHTIISVTRKPRIAVLATGDELTRPGQSRTEAQIVASSLYGVLAQLESWGAHAIDLGIASDDVHAIVAAAKRATDADMLITLGGASVGDHDLVREALDQAGLDLEFWKIAMRPGKPLMFGTYASKPFVGLPGNPVSSMVCSLLFVKPAIFKMLGVTDEPFRIAHLPLTVPVAANDGREDYLRATIDREGVTPLPVQDSAQLSALANADVLIVRPPKAPALARGALVPVIYLENA